MRAPEVKRGNEEIPKVATLPNPGVGDAEEPDLLLQCWVMGDEFTGPGGANKRATNPRKLTSHLRAVEFHAEILLYLRYYTRIHPAPTKLSTKRDLNDCVG